jgi:ribosome recycling factor
MAAKEDDGTISRDEQKTLDRIQKATDKYISELQKLK